VLWGLKFIQFGRGAVLRKRIQNYEHKIRYVSEYLCIKRKKKSQQITNFKKVDKYHKDLKKIEKIISSLFRDVARRRLVSCYRRFGTICPSRCQGPRSQRLLET